MTVGNTDNRANSRCNSAPATTDLIPRAPRKRPSQGRSQHTVDVIVEAATRIFDKVGIQATTNQIAELAGVSIGSLYQYFPNKLALITELHERHRALVAKSVLGALDAMDSRPLDEVVLHVVQCSLSVHRDRPGLQQVLHAQLPQLSLQDDASPAKQNVGNRVYLLLQAHLPGGDQKSLSLAVQTLLTMCECLVHDVVLNPRADADDLAAARNIARALCGYLDRLALTR